MMSFPLLKQTIKSNGLVWGVMTVIMAVLLIQFTAMEETKFLLFLCFYGMITLIFPTVYILISSNKLLAGQVDRGSMAYVLSTPKRRITVCTTQMIFSICTIVIMFVVTAVAHVIINQASPLALDSEAFMQIGLTGLTGNLTAVQIIKINLSAMSSCLALGGVCYMFSGIFNLSKYSIGASGVVAGASMLTALLGIFGKVMNNGLKNIRYASMFAFFDYESVLTGENTWWILMIAALVVAALTYAIGAVWFSKKDLPL